MLYNIFISKRIKEKQNKLLFKIEGLKTQTDDETYSASSELENLQGNGLSNVRNAEFETGYGNREHSNKFRSKWKCIKTKISSRMIRPSKKNNKEEKYRLKNQEKLKHLTLQQKLKREII